MKKILSIILGIMFIFVTVFSSSIFSFAVSNHETSISEVGTPASPGIPNTPSTPNNPNDNTDLGEALTPVPDATPDEPIIKEPVATPQEPTTEEVIETTTEVPSKVGTETDAEKEHGNIIINQGDVNIDIDVSLAFPDKTTEKNEITTTTKPEEVTSTTKEETTTYFYYDWIEPTTKEDINNDLYIPDTGSAPVIGSIVALGLAAGAIILLKKKKIDE